MFYQMWKYISKAHLDSKNHLMVKLVSVLLVDSFQRKVVCSLIQIISLWILNYNLKFKLPEYEAL